MQIITRFTIIVSMNLLPKMIIPFGLTLLGAVHSGAAEAPKQPSDIKIEVGIGTRNQAPLVLVAGLDFRSLAFRVQGMGMHYGENDFWASIRGSLLWTCFSELPFKFDVGIGAGYEYAEAPNKMHQAINNANKKKYVYPFNYKEELDISMEMWVHMYGLYTQISVPFYQFKDHDAQNVLWGVGFTYTL